MITREIDDGPVCRKEGRKEGHVTAILVAAVVSGVSKNAAPFLSFPFGLTVGNI